MWRDGGGRWKKVAGWGGSDVIKLRHLTYGAFANTKDLPSFSIPRHPRNRWRASLSCRKGGPRQYSVFRYNDSNITGYSACCGPCFAALHDHRGIDDDDLSFYETTPQGLIWIYMPVEKDERIVNIWGIQSYSLNRQLILAFETNRGRLLIFGEYDERKELLLSEWDLMSSPRGEPGFFCFDSTPAHRIHEIAFDDPPPNENAPPAPPEAYLPHSDQPWLLENAHWSSASVENVVKIVPCRQTMEGNMMITGLLLCYSDGNKASLGHIRLDRLDPALQVDESKKLHLGFKKAKCRGFYVAKVELSTNELDSDMDGWFGVSWSGTLEWCFSYRSCQVWQDGCGSMVGQH